MLLKTVSFSHEESWTKLEQFLTPFEPFFRQISSLFFKSKIMQVQGRQQTTGIAVFRRLANTRIIDLIFPILFTKNARIFCEWKIILYSKAVPGNDQATQTTEQTVSSSGNRKLRAK